MDGNESQIQNLASILLNNALSYTPENGSIEIHAHIHSRKFYLSVENTGDPIPEEIRDRLFERFFRADEARADNGHFGLGLIHCALYCHEPFRQNYRRTAGGQKCIFRYAACDFPQIIQQHLIATMR